MNDVVLAALVGGLVAVVGSWIRVYVTSKPETKRHLHRLGFELAVIEWKQHLAAAKVANAKTGQPQRMLPPFLYFWGNLRLVEALSETSDAVMLIGSLKQS